MSAVEPGTSPDRIAATMLDLAGARGPDRTICPSEVARALGGDHPDGWGPLMPAVRRAAVRLMKEGRVVVTRKGRPVDPDDFRGVYRIRVAPDAEVVGDPPPDGAPLQAPTERDHEAVEPER